MENAVKTIFQEFCNNNPESVACNLLSTETQDSYSIGVHADDREEAVEFGAELEPLLDSVSKKHGKRAELEILP